MATKAKPEPSPPAPDELPLLPLRNLVLFPGVVAPVDVGRPSSLRLIDEVATRAPARVLVVTQRDPQVEEPSPGDLHVVAVEAELLKVARLGDARATALLRGLERRRLGRITRREGFLVAASEPAPDRPGDPVEVEGLALVVREAARKVIEQSPEIPDEAAVVIDQLRDPGRLADVAASHLDLSTDDRVALLAELDVVRRLRRVHEHLQHRLEVFRVKERIDAQVREELSRHQREAVLREKLKAIQEELGELGDELEDFAELDERLKTAGMPEEVEKVARKQLERLRTMPAASAEHSVTRTYVEWLLDVPWSRATQDHLDLAEARRVLDEDHYDLEKVKRRIVEYLAVRKLKPDKKGPILCLAGPPGVGKTSLGRSIARALGREFVRISLGGIHDEAEIRGHRRTYIGALPGRILQGMKRAGSRNPVFMLDEIDKLGADFRGDPSSALLEVLDPEQNHTFSDHYLEVPYDLSSVMFIATANYLDPIPPALRDRLEILELPGYTRQEKLHIARRYLLPKQLEEHGLSRDLVELPDAVLSTIVERYTREAGVRNLEREIAAVCRGIAVKVAAGDTFRAELGVDDLAEHLGPERFTSEVAERTEEPGVATGLAWTPTGGEILFIEASRMPGKGNLVLTGQLGNVMKESAQAALSFVRARAASLGLQPDFFEKSDLHVHVPGGSIPKDGPSAGVALATAIVSLLSGRPVRGDVAMTGEITLRGNVLPVGGVKDKLLAAHRAGIRKVLLPERNRKDVVDVPPEVLRELELCYVRKLEEALGQALEREVLVPLPMAGEVALPTSP